MKMLVLAWVRRETPVWCLTVVIEMILRVLGTLLESTIALRMYVLARQRCNWPLRRR